MVTRIQFIIVCFLALIYGNLEYTSDKLLNSIPETAEKKWIIKQLIAKRNTFYIAFWIGLLSWFWFGKSTLLSNLGFVWAGIMLFFIGLDISRYNVCELLGF